MRGSPEAARGRSASAPDANARITAASRAWRRSGRTPIRRPARSISATTSATTSTTRGPPPTRTRATCTAASRRHFSRTGKDWCPIRCPGSDSARARRGRIGRDRRSWRARPPCKRHRRWGGRCRAPRRSSTSLPRTRCSIRASTRWTCGSPNH